MANIIKFGGGSASGDATAADLLLNKTATVDAGEITGTMPNNGAISHSLAVNGTYTVPAGYHNGSGSVTQALTTKGAQTYTPGTTNQTIAANQYLTGVQTIEGDADLVSANIKAGANIFGVAGATNVVDTTAGTAVAGDILSGKIAFVDGAQITGTIASKGAQTYTPSTTDQTIAAGQYLSGTQTISGDADLVAGNIKNGVDVFGVLGTYKGKILEGGIILGWTAPENFAGFWFDSTGAYYGADSWPSKTGEYLSIYRSGSIVYIQVIKQFTGVKFDLPAPSAGTFAVNTILQVSLASGQVKGFLVLS